MSTLVLKQPMPALTSLTSRPSRATGRPRVSGSCWAGEVECELYRRAVDSDPATSLCCEPCLSLMEYCFLLQPFSSGKSVEMF